MEMENRTATIGYDAELGGWVIKADSGSYILFKDGDIHIKAQKELLLNIGLR
jgi:hypothetical protein